MPLTEIIDSQMPSMTEWLEKIGVKNAADFRAEDNSKRDRLEILFGEIGLPYTRPEKLEALDIANQTPKFLKILQDKGDKKCALRLMPKKDNLPKLRVRGKTLKENLVWYHAQAINPADYLVEIVPHEQNIYSAIFIINDRSVWGEIIPGGHWKLTQGFHENELMVFLYQSGKWRWQGNDDLEAKKIIEQAVLSLKVYPEKQNILKQKLSAQFTAEGYLKGYFEFTVLPEVGTQFIDYNRLLVNLASPILSTEKPPVSELSGICASPGQARGIAKIVLDPKTAEFNAGEILVCPMTMVDYIPLMQKSAGIITEQGNLLSHAAIISRELKKPCLIGVKQATKKIKNGQTIQLNADAGTIQIIT